MAKERNLKTDEIIKIVYEESGLIREDYFNTTVFYYLSGRFPDLTIRQCTEIITQIHDKMLEEHEKE